jgi:luciferase-like monooxygenase
MPETGALDDQTSICEGLRAWILQLPGVKEAPHRVGGIEFRVGGVEFMHSHGASSLDIRLSKEDQASVLKTGQALPHRAIVHRQDGWISLRIERLQDLANARKVVHLAYENAKKNLEDTKAENAVKLR